MRRSGLSKQPTEVTHSVNARRERGSEPIGPQRKLIERIRLQINTTTIKHATTKAATTDKIVVTVADAVVGIAVVIAAAW